MRLIHTTRLELDEFFGSRIPEYAILSHCWAKDAKLEVTYLDFLSGAKRSGDGWWKIRKCCEIARAENIDWVWVDTCCIDKSSSTELQEAINSMYRWYKEAKVCCAFLLDYHCAEEYGAHSLSSPGGTRKIPHGAVTKLENSAWFTRGWTLQELLAPPKVLFFDCTGAQFGSKADLAETLSTIAGIGVEYLRGEKSITAASVSCRMSWASKRVTTREEDIAYCLLGLFGINMPLLYGEGSGAFQRLQEEIIKTIDDHTLFAWTRLKQTADTPSPPEKATWWDTIFPALPTERSSILARSPEEFWDGAFFVPVNNSNRPCQVHSIGIQFFLDTSLQHNRYQKGYGTSDWKNNVLSMRLPLACRDIRWTKNLCGYDCVEIALLGSRPGEDKRIFHRTETDCVFKSDDTGIVHVAVKTVVWCGRLPINLIQMIANTSNDIYVQRAQSAS